MANLQQSNNANTSMASIAQESGNMDQGQISNQGTVAVTRNEGLGSQLNVSGQGSQLIKKIKQQNIKIRFATNERSQAEVPVPKANLKLKNLNQGAKNFMIKPSSIISNQPFNSVIQAKPKNIPLLVPMTEKEFTQKKEAVIKEYHPKLQDIAQLKQHYEQRISDRPADESNSTNPLNFDIKIKERLDREQEALQRAMDGELTKLRNQFEQA